MRVYFAGFNSTSLLSSIINPVWYAHTILTMETVNNKKVAGNMILYDEVLTSKLATSAGCLYLLLTITVVLPEGVKAVSVESYGTSAWSQTGRINATDAKGTQTSYFLKVRHRSILMYTFSYF